MIKHNGKCIHHTLVYNFIVRGSVHHNTILTVKNQTRCDNVSKFNYSLF